MPKRKPLDLVSTADAAEILGVQPRHVLRLVEAGALDVATEAAGGRFLFYRADIDRLHRKGWRGAFSGWRDSS